MTKDEYGGISGMFEPTHNSYDYEEEADWVTWAFAGAFIALFIIGLAIANHFGLTVQL